MSIRPRSALWGEFVKRSVTRTTGTAAVVALAIASAVLVRGAQPAGAVVPADGGVNERDLLGHSVAGRPIYAYRMGNPYSPIKALVLGNMHGDEPAGITVANAIINGTGIHDVDLWVIPTINPDGTAAHRHGNAHGVDLNRNFPDHWARLTGYHYSGPYASSEPETRIMLSFLKRLRPRYFVSMHQPLNGVDTTDGGARDPAFRQRLASNLGLPQKAFNCFSVCQGTMTGWFTDHLAGAAITVEFPAAVAGSYLTGRAAPGIVKAVGARYDTPADHNPFGRVDTASTKGSQVTITGWALDPDIRTSSMVVRVTEGSATRWQHTTATLRSYVNALYHTTGYHGFRAVFTAPNGVHTYCVNLINYGIGTASPRYCFRRAVNGSPTGRVTAISAPVPGHFAVSGWAYDPDVVPASSYVTITVDADAATAVTVPANQARPAGTYPVAGNHGYSLAMETSPGVHQVCVLARNAGPAAPSVTVGCASVTVTFWRTRATTPS
jgi:murein peptide amidase A